MIAATASCNTCGAALNASRYHGRCAPCLFAEAFQLPEEEEAGPLGTIGGHDLIEEIARGGMGVVYRARQREPAREVALKTIRGAELDSPAALMRFRQEAKAMADLEHAAILPVFAFGEHEGIPHFTMKLATGGTLAERLGDYAGKWREIAELVARVAEAVQHAHTHAVLHRDLKPGNILYDESGRAFVSDFGLAKLLDSTDRALTRTAAVLGTPHYLAPEIAAHDTRAATTASDVWSLGVILYELLAQRRPFEGDSIQEILRAITDTEPASLREVPRDLAIIAMKALAREPARRYATAAALAEDLHRWLEAGPISARPVSSAERLQLWARRNPMIASLWALLAASVITAAILLVAAYREANTERLNGREALRTALLTEAQSRIVSGRAGQRFAALESLRRAAAIRPGTDLASATAAALARPDLRFTQLWPAATPSSFNRPEFSPDLEQFAALKQGGFSLHAAVDGKELRHFPTSKRATAFAFAPNGKSLAAMVAPRSVQIWAIDGSAPLAEVESPPLAGMSEGIGASFSGALGAWAVIAADGAIVQVSAEGEKSELIPAHGQAAGSILFEPEGERLAVAYHDSVEVWQVREPRKLWAYPLRRMSPAMAWHPRGLYLAITSDSEQRDVIVLDATNGSLRSRLSGSTQSMSRLAFHPTLYILAGAASDSTVRLWDYRDGSPLLVAPGTTRTLRWSSNGRRLGNGIGLQQLGIMQFESDALFREFGGFDSYSVAMSGHKMAASQDGLLLVTDGPLGLGFWSTKTRGHVGEFLPIRRQFFAPFITPDAKWVAYASQEAGKGIARRPLTFDPMRNQLRIGAEELLAGSSSAELHGITHENAWLVHHSDSNRWEHWADGDAKRATPLQTTGRYTAVFSPDLRWTLPFMNGPVVRGMDRSTGKQFELTGPGAVAFSPDSRWLLLRAPEENALFEVGTWRQRARWPAGGDNYVRNCFAFSSDSKRLAISFADESLKIFTVPEAREVITLTPPRPLGLRSVVFSPDGRRLWAMGAAARIFEWDLGVLERELEALGIPWER